MSLDSCTNTNSIIEDVKEYYGKTLQTNEDLQTSACSTKAQRMPPHIAKVMKLIHDEVVSKYFGCGLVVPTCLEKMKILDLGCGSGRDCYALSKLVGPNGFITGVDMTEEQLEVANRHIDYHTKVFGYDEPNVKFVNGFIENLRDCGIEDDSVDIIISNCVVNLCKDKREVLREAFRVLKDGGEMYFSDVYADRELSNKIRCNKELWGEGLGGALYWKQLFALAKEIGFETPRTVTLSSFDINKPNLQKLVDGAKYASVVYRLFKLPANADRTACQVTYNGTVTACEKELNFDHTLTFETGQSVTVDGNTSAILKQSRLGGNFTFQALEENPFVLLASLTAPEKVSSCCGDAKKSC